MPKLKDLLHEPLSSSTYLVNAELADGWMPVGGLCLSMMPADFQREWADILESPVIKTLEDGPYGQEIHLQVSDESRLQDFPFAILPLKNPMTALDFEQAIQLLLPGSSAKLTTVWIEFASEIAEHARAWLTDCAEEIERGESQFLAAWYQPRSVAGNNLQEIHASLYKIDQQYGADICRQVYEMANIPFCTYPLEALNVAEYLSNGGSLADFDQQYDLGRFEWEIPKDTALLMPDGQRFDQISQQSQALSESRRAGLIDGTLHAQPEPGLIARLHELEPPGLTMA